MEQESTVEAFRPIFIGRLRDLGLGNPEGIPSRLADATAEELEDYADLLIRQLEPATVSDSFSCIDGREIVATADGAAPEVRLRRVGGSAANYGVALNAGMNVANPKEADELTETKRSAHTENCGGANGEVADNEAISEDPKILSAAEVFLSIPEVARHFGVSFDDEAAEAIKNNAAMTAARQKAEGWSGQAYVDEVASDQPASVDSLQGDAEHPFNGHDEDALVVIIGNKTLRNGDFVWNLDASKKAIDGLVKHGGDRTRLTIAETAKHLKVGDRLPSDTTPVIVLAAA